MITYLVSGMVIGVAVVVWVKLRAAFRLFRITLPSLNVNEVDSLPSVSLCIPARNETHAMTACLESALSSAYPKLEIIVLDDGSRDDTGHLIKSFAHSGVRFVEGTPLPDGWLGKNHALQALYRESSGSLILFADVDTRFSVHSITQLVAYMQQENADMVSVLPFRQNTMRASAIFATFRHFWNIVGHTRKNPAAASNAWIVRRDVLDSTFHGLKDLALSVRPERQVARELAQRSTYRFVISSGQLGVSYEKKLSSQYETAYRLYYPDFGFVGVVKRVAAILLCLLPFVLVIYHLFAGDYVSAAVAFVATLVVSIINAWYLGVLRSNNYGIASICLPFLMIREVYLLCASVFKYKQNKITWKGRSVQIR